MVSMRRRNLQITYLFLILNGGKVEMMSFKGGRR